MASPPDEVSSLRVRPGVVAVARAAGVSPATVSNTYNRPAVVSAELRERVLRAAEVLGYGGGDPSARRLRGHRAGAIGLVMRERLAYAFDDPAVVEVLRGISESADRDQLGLVIVPAYPESGTTDGPAVRHAAVDGLVLYSLTGDDPLVAAARKRHLPTVVIDSPRAGDGAQLGPSGLVGIDEQAAGAAVVDHLVGLGHRRIGFLTSRLSAAAVPGVAGAAELAASPASVVTGRLAGARTALARVGMRPRVLPVVQCRTSSVAEGIHGGHVLLDRFPDLTAVVALTDLLALGVQSAAAERGRRLPDELSVAGFDDVAPPAAGLTSIHQPHREKGQEAADLLRRWVDRGEPPTGEVVLATQLVVRASTAPAPAPGRVRPHQRTRFRSAD